MATDYSLDLKASLDTAEVQEKLNDLSFKGRHATSDLEVAVKRLDNAVQDLTRTWEKQAEAARKAAENAEEAAKANGQGGADANGATGSFIGQATGLLAARRLRGLKKIVEKIDGADGQMSEGGTVLTSSLGWAGSGAAMGSAFGPAGTAIGALAGAIYGVKDGFDQLQKAADAAAKRLQDIADTNRERYRNFLIGERKRIVREETLASINGGELSDERLQGYVDRYQKKKSEYNERIKRGAEDSQTEDEYINEMKGLKDMLDEAAVYAQAAQKEIERRAKAEEAAARAAEKKAAADEKQAQKIQELVNKENETAFKKLDEFTRGENLERFKKELGQMKPGDLRRTGLDLLEQQEQLKHDYVDQLKNGDLKAAEKVKNDLDENKSRLGMIEDLLNQALKIQGIAQYGGQLLGDEGAKGYDVGQYDSVENALFRAQLDTSKQINQNVTDLKTTLQTINDTTIQMRNKLDQNGGGSTYGNG